MFKRFEVLVMLQSIYRFCAILAGFGWYLLKSMFTNFEQKRCWNSDSKLMTFGRRLGGPGRAKACRTLQILQVGAATSTHARLPLRACGESQELRPLPPAPQHDGMVSAGCHGFACCHGRHSGCCAAGFQASGSRPFQDSSEPRIAEKLATWIEHLGLPRVSDRDRLHVLMFSAADLMVSQHRWPGRSLGFSRNSVSEHEDMVPSTGAISSCSPLLGAPESSVQQTTSLSKEDTFSATISLP